MYGGKSCYKTTLSLPVGKYNTGWINPLNPAFFSQEEGILPVMISAAEDYTQSALVFYCTEDGGKNWSMLSMVEDVGRVSWELTLKIVSEQDIFFVCVTDLCVSHDGAKSWQRLSSNLDFGNPDQLSYVQQFSFGDPATGLALVEGIDDTISLWRTEDGGLSWQALSPQIVPKEN
jgi:hypothetical protein